MAATYEALGSPTLFWNNSPRTGWRFMRFLFGRDWRDLSDPALASVCGFMRIFLVLYLLFVFGPLLVGSWMHQV